VTTIQAGDAYNVIPQTAVIRGTFSNDTMTQIENGMRRTTAGVAAAPRPSCTSKSFLTNEADRPYIWMHDAS
jgi:metal-dependent amidase/aminoacylase/carboxypeptidase family protein